MYKQLSNFADSTDETIHEPYVACIQNGIITYYTAVTLAITSYLAVWTYSLQ